jgi:hypothetical protein
MTKRVGRYLAICAMLFCHCVCGQVFVARRDYNPNGFGVLWPGLVVFDANGDGIPDLVSSSGGLTVFLGNGDGTFAVAPIVTFFGNDGSLLGISAADLNGDGIIDLVGMGQFTSPSDSQGLGVTFGNGDGTFGPLTLYPGGVQPIFVAGPSLLVDVNNDGKLDAVVVGFWSEISGDQSGVQVWLGNGDGTFGNAIVSTATGPLVGLGLAAAKFNASGYLDLAVTNSDGVQIWTGDGTGHFTQGPYVAYEPNATAVATADLNHDGFADIVVVGYFKSYATVVLGNGDGTFQEPTRTPLSSGLLLEIGDVNGDGNPDLVAAGYTDGATVALGNGDGIFGDPHVWYTSAPPESGLALAKLQKDAPLDIVTAGEDISVLLHATPDAFEEGIRYPLSGAGCLAVADFNGDGHPDVAVNITAGFQILFGTGMAAAPFTAGPTTSTGQGCVYAGDFNHDGIPDLVTVEGDASPYDIDVFLGNGDGTFQPPSATSVPVATGELAVGDVRGNGKMDVITNTGYLLLGNGDGTLQEPVYLFAVSSYSNGPIYVAAADLNGDGRTDLVFSAALKENYVAVLISNGDGTFTRHFYTFDGELGYAGAIAIADYNGDGIPDIAVLAYGGSEIQIYLGNGDGTFTPEPPTLYSAVGILLIAGDFNADGKMDLASLTSNDNVALLLGNGDGTFTQGELLGGPVPLYDYALANLHGQKPGEGGPDIITTNRGEVDVLINLGK